MKRSFVMFLFLVSICFSFLSAETREWTNVKGEVIKAQLTGVIGDHAFFTTLTGSSFKFPIAALSPADQAYLEGWRERKIEAKQKVMSAESGIRLSESPIAKLVSPHLVRPGGGTSFAKAPLSMSATPKYYAFYYSAHWCPPCKGFTPELVKFYDRMKQQGADFEIVFVSADRSPKEMHRYMSEYKMNWPAVDYDVARKSPQMNQFGGDGIPCLVFVDHTGKVISDSYVNGNYVGPRKVLKDMDRILRSTIGKQS